MFDKGVEENDVGHELSLKPRTDSISLGLTGTEKWRMSVSARGMILLALVVLGPVQHSCTQHAT